MKREISFTNGIIHLYVTPPSTKSQMVMCLELPNIVGNFPFLGPTQIHHYFKLYIIFESFRRTEAVYHDLTFIDHMKWAFPLIGLHVNMKQRLVETTGPISLHCTHYTQFGRIPPPDVTNSN